MNPWSSCHRGSPLSETTTDDPNSYWRFCLDKIFCGCQQRPVRLTFNYKFIQETVCLHCHFTVCFHVVSPCKWLRALLSAHIGNVTLHAYWWNGCVGGPSWQTVHYIENICTHHFGGILAHACWTSQATGLSCHIFHKKYLFWMNIKMVWQRVFFWETGPTSLAQKHFGTDYSLICILLHRFMKTWLSCNYIYFLCTKL